jgi:cytochrome c oxidase assembly protein subunit 15
MFSSKSTAAIKPHGHFSSSNLLLRWLSKITCASTLFLIFAGAMVKSTDSGLAVPDWPLSYGMFFPPMIGGVFYEHGHRMVATTVGILMLGLAITLKFKEPRGWVRILGYCALCMVILQGILGGITVLFFLPTPISVFHGVLAQIFFILTIIIAYIQSNERLRREYTRFEPPSYFLKLLILWIAFIFIQLILGAIMRHTGSGLAIPDFPKMGGHWVPQFDAVMLNTINNWRFENNLDPITQVQIFYHFLHRLGALLILILFALLNFIGFRTKNKPEHILNTLLLLDYFVIIQIVLGAMTVLSHKLPMITSLHVVTGAAILGISVLLLLRTAPLSYNDLKQSLTQ